MIKIFIGFDQRETVAFNVLQHSIRARVTCPIAICPLDRNTLRGIYDRPRGQLESTDFSLSRFIVPYLCNYEGWAVFMDCDMLCLGDVAEFANYMTLATRWTKAVSVVKHDYTPKEETKFLGERQTKYEKKLWSSLMIFNNALCHNLTKEAVNSRDGLWLHQFKWTSDDLIGEIPQAWNWIPGHSAGMPKMVHYTEGGIWFNHQSAYAAQWLEEKENALSHD